MKKIRVLYIDDEMHNLNTFKAAFRKRYEIYTATGVLDARKILKSIEIPVIIADQRMPGTTGIEFFNSIKSAHPHAVRILVTAFSDVEALVDAINKGQIFRFLKKPWDYYDLQNTITNAYDKYTTKKELESKIKELEKTTDELGRFVTRISQDIRLPVLSALGIINLSKSDPALDGQSEYITIIKDNLQRVDSFLQTMIDYYKNVNTYPEYEEIDFRALIHDCIEICKKQDPSVEFQVKVDQQRTFNNDLYRISIILNSLIANAIQYKNPEAADAIVKLSATTEEDNAIISIEDNGIGILKDHLNKIFQLFFQSGEVKTSGSGVGLYVAKEALSRLGGEISVSSIPGEGTKFTITIPNQNVENN